MNNTLDIRRFAVARPARTSARVFRLPLRTAQPSLHGGPVMRWSIDSTTARPTCRWQLAEASPADVPRTRPSRADMRGVRELLAA